LISNWSGRCLLVLASVVAGGCGSSEVEVVSVQRIWGQAPHSAFTDLVRFRDSWFCTFREGESHVSYDGSIRVISSSDGETWSSTAHISGRPEQDLRDPKLVVAPDGRLMVLGLDRRLQGEDRYEFFSWVAFSEDGSNWSDPVEVGEADVFMWRVTWNQGVAYATGYTDRRAFSHRSNREELVRLYRSEDGTQFDPYVNYLFERGSPSEASIVFQEDETAVCLLRRDGGDNSAQIGTSAPPYDHWNWKDLGLPIGGPHLVSLPDGRLVGSGRLRLEDKESRTALWWLDPDAGTATEILRLPSGGDTSYAGMVFHEDLLWVSYYSTHEEKTSIYLAKVSLPSP